MLQIQRVLLLYYFPIYPISNMFVLILQLSLRMKNYITGSWMDGWNITGNSKA